MKRIAKFLFLCIGMMIGEDAGFGATSNSNYAVSTPTIVPTNTFTTESGTVHVSKFVTLGSAIDVSVSQAQSMINNPKGTRFQAIYIKTSDTPTLCSYVALQSGTMSTSMSDIGFAPAGYKYYGTYFMLGTNAFNNEFAVHNLVDSLGLLPVFRISTDSDIPSQGSISHSLTTSFQPTVASAVYTDSDIVDLAGSFGSAIDLTFQ